MNNTTIKQAAMVSHILLLGCSFKKIELKIAVAKGINATIIKVLATYVFSIEIMNVVLPKAINIAYNKPGIPVIKKAFINCDL